MIKVLLLHVFFILISFFEMISYIIFLSTTSFYDLWLCFFRHFIDRLCKRDITNHRFSLYDFTQFLLYFLIENRGYGFLRGIYCAFRSCNPRLIFSPKGHRHRECSKILPYEILLCLNRKWCVFKAFYPVFDSIFSFFLSPS